MDKQLKSSSAELVKAAKYLSEQDPVLAVVIESADTAKIAPHKNYYQELVDSIISQQLSVKAAATILKRFIELFPERSFPTPEDILLKTAEELRSVGLSKQKVGYIQDLAQKVIDRTIQFDELDASSNDEIISELTKVKGIGVWTVHMFLIFCMGRLDVLPTGDLGIRNGIKKLYGFESLPLPQQIEVLAQDNKWHPYESVASWYIWHSLDNKPQL